MDSALPSGRRLLPRWRSFSRTPAREIASIYIGKTGFLSPADPLLVERLYYQWRNNPTIENAGEVINAAVLLKEPFLAIGPAQMIRNDERVMPAVRAIAESIVKGPAQVDIENRPEMGGTDTIRRRIRRLKARLVDEPRNGLLSLEKARLHTLIGDLDSAERSFRHSLACAPTSRVILRAYVRFMTHCNRAKEGHDRLKRLSILRHDPWLQAAEIAVAEAAGRTPLSASYAQTFLADSDLPIQFSELASALATLEANSGHVRVAKRLFRKSLVLPTDNALSQAFWARDDMHLQGLTIAPEMLMLKGAFEARVQAAMANKRWQDAADHCQIWLEDEPYSVRAAITGSYIAASFLWNHKLAIGFCEQGLMPNPDNRILTNNMAVSLCRIGRCGDAEIYLNRIKDSIADIAPDPVVLATVGLLAFRSGDIEKGRAFYTRSIETSAKLRAYDTEFRARYNWLAEEARAGTISDEHIEKIVALLDAVLLKANISVGSRESWLIAKDRLRDEVGQEEDSSMNEGELTLLSLLS